MSLKNQIIGGLTVSQRDKVLNMLREWIKFKGETVAQSTHNQQNVYHYVFNNSGETIPSYACVQVTGTKELGEQNYLLGEKPADGTGDAGWYVFNGFEEIADQEIGICYDGPLVRALVEGNLSAGDLVSPQADSWSLAEGSLFPYAGADDILPNVHKVFTNGGGGGCELMIFTVKDVYGVETKASDHCDDELNDAKNQYYVECVKACCGGKPSGAEPDGSYLVNDYFSMWQGGIGGAREEADVIGKEGLAIRMKDCDGYGDCQWYVIWINWFRTIEVVVNVRMTEDSIIFDKKNVEVWDDCEIDPVIIPLTDCEAY